jgi:hypothetical protein
MQGHTHQVFVRLPLDLFNRLSYAATPAVADLSKSQILRAALRDWLDKNILADNTAPPETQVRLQDGSLIPLSEAKARGIELVDLTK